MQKKERDQYAATLTEQAWLLTDFFTGRKRTFPCRSNAENPKQAWWTHLASSCSQSERKIHLARSQIQPYNKSLYYKIQAKNKSPYL